MTEEILKTAEELQKEAHIYASAYFPAVSNKVSYQDLVNTWLFLKLDTIMRTKENIQEKKPEDIEYKPGYNSD